MPSADFCTAVRVPHDTPSSIWNTAQTSRGKNISLHRTPAEFTTPALADMDFMTICSLVRLELPHIRFLPGHDFATRFLQTPPHDDALALH